MNRKILLTTFLVIIAAAGIALWYFLKAPALPDGLYSTNGRLEAEQVQVATKTAGRVAEVLVEEGQHYVTGEIKIEGNAIFPESEIWQTLEMLPGQTYSQFYLFQEIARRFSFRIFEKSYDESVRFKLIHRRKSINPQNTG